MDNEQEKIEVSKFQEEIIVDFDENDCGDEEEFCIETDDCEDFDPKEQDDLCEENDENQTEEIDEQENCAKQLLDNGDELEGCQETHFEQEADVWNAEKVGVYVKVDESGFVTDVGSDVFIEDLDGWIKIDEGVGDRFVHAQTQYYDSPLIDFAGNFKFKLQ